MNTVKVINETAEEVQISYAKGNGYNQSTMAQQGLIWKLIDERSIEVMSKNALQKIDKKDASELITIILATPKEKKIKLIKK